MDFFEALFENKNAMKLAFQAAINDGEAPEGVFEKTLRSAREVLVPDSGYGGIADCNKAADASKTPHRRAVSGGFSVFRSLTPRAHNRG